MKLFKKTLAALATIGTFAVAGNANATLTNWYLDVDGAGGNAPVLVQDYLDLVGTAYVNNSFSSPTAFTFNEVGRFTTSTADGGSLSGGADLASSLSSFFTGTGAGTVGGTLTFLTGSLDVFSGATNIADFSLLAGNAILNTGTVLPNGDVSLIFKATSMLPGYFFDSAMNDLALIVSDPDGLLMGFATTNVIARNGQIVPTGLVSDYNSAFDPDLVAPVTSNSSTDLLLSNNGQFRLVPEPASLALAGIALVGLAGLRRRKEVK